MPPYFKPLRRKIGVVTLGLACVFVARWMTNWAPGLSNRKQDFADLSEVYIGLVNYEEVFGHLPPASRKTAGGQPTVSWRYLVAHFVQVTGLSWKPDEPWDGDANRPWREIGDVLSSARTTRTNARAFAIVDGATAISETEIHRLSDLPEWLWIVVYVSSSNHHWMKPGDLMPQDLKELLEGQSTKFGIEIRRSFSVLTASGHKLEIDAKIPWQVVEPLLTENSNPTDAIQAIRPYVRSPQ